MVDPVYQVQIKVNRIKYTKKALSRDGPVTSFSQALAGINRAIANAKVIRRTAGKIRRHDPSSQGLKALIKNLWGYAQCLLKLDEECDIDGQLQRAPFQASALQEDRETIQETLGKHRNLNPYGGEHLTDGREQQIYGSEDIKRRNKALRAAGVDNRIHNSSDRYTSEDDTHADHKVHWCHISNWIKQAHQGRRWIDLLSDKAFLEQIDLTIQHLQSMKSPARHRRKKATLLATQHAGLTMATGTLKRMYNPQPRELPEPQHMIKDLKSGEWRPCKSIEENGRATREHHQRWMDESKAEFQCLFGELTKDEVGINGVKLRNSMNWIRNNISKGIRNFDELPAEGRIEYLRAHKTLAPLFQEGGKHCEALIYPFFYLGSTGEFPDPTVRIKFYDSIVSTPGKARDESFTLHVLARLSPTWREGMLLFIQNVLVNRCPPSSIKEMSRLPIPKGPEKPGQTRPIALVNDIYAFISSMIACRMAEGIDASGRLGPEVRAYRKNMSTTDITMNERCLMEDAMEFEKPTCRKLEGEILR